MAEGTITIGVNIGGLSFQKSVKRTADHSNTYGPITLNAAKSGTLSTRTNDTDGELTMSGGHGITNGQIIDIYWASGVTFGATVGTVNVNAVPFTGGTGDVLPAQSTAITAAVQQVINTQIDGDAISLMGLIMESSSLESTVAGHIVFHDASHASIEEIDLVANAGKAWDITGGDTNVFTGNAITHAHATRGAVTTTETITLKVMSLEDSTP